MQFHAKPHQDNDNRTPVAPEMSRAEAATQRYQFVDNRPATAQLHSLQSAMNDSPRVIAQRKRIGSLFPSEATPAQLRVTDDLYTRGLAGALNDGEVTLSRRPDVGAVDLHHLAQSLKPVIQPNATPVADALNGNTAAVTSGQVQMKGIDASSDPISIARQVGQLRPKDARIRQFAGGRFELQARLNPWVSVVTGTVVEGLASGSEKPKNGERHSDRPDVVWRDEAPEDDDADAYAAFMQCLAEIDDDESLKPKVKQALKSEMLLAFHGHLQTLPAAAILKFGTDLKGAIDAHEEADSLDTAFGENRAIYRTWHEPKRIAESTTLGESEEGGKELVGADSLNVALDPVRFRAHKEQTKRAESGLAPLGAAPSSLLYGDLKGNLRNTVFLRDRATAAALLPENLNAGFSLFNETAKSIFRSKAPDDELDPVEQELHQHAKLMRSSVTRPVFFDNGDIQSSVGAYRHDEKGEGLHVRKTHSALGEDHNPLRESLEEKLQDPLRRNAIFYQTFSQHSRANVHGGAWNEMVVKYRGTGKTAALDDNVAQWVPGIPTNDTIAPQLLDSGKFSKEYAAATKAEADTALDGKAFDPDAEQLDVEQAVSAVGKRRGKKKKGGQ
ncbi:hypothetical protein [Pandoraea commovens]|uniref:Uncharacterized protein n=1 Tax=Pandoraea commovens TaxID=2508289 RepID=A0A5E4RP73_9BURK|nr:hypothetical protein [Pandoraea commovens]VVD64825.1 hypothetical protein PCO31010_00298 [Pandoraea commovens]